MEQNLNLNPVEEKELQEGQQLYELTKTAGFEILKRRLEDMAFHSWVDPREIEGPEAEKEWKWRELNAFHAANNAREILEWVQQAISQAEYLDKKKKGEIRIQPMKI